MLCNYCKVTKNVFTNHDRSHPPNLNSTWLCSRCLGDILPFNHYLDDDDFQMAILDFSFNSDANLLNLNNLIFNPLLVDFDSQSNVNDAYSSNDTIDSPTTSSYFLEDQFNRSLPPNHQDRFSIIHFNARSLNRNFDHISNYLDLLNHSFSVIGITESWLKTSSDLPPLDGYNCIHNPRNTRGGGVALYISDNFSITERTDISFGNTAESLFIDLTDHNNNKITVGVVYRPTDTNLSNFNSTLSTILPKLNSLKNPCFVLGDFNINLINSQTHSLTNDFLTTLIQHTFYPTINKPTRITRTSASLIDNIFTSHHPNNSLNGIVITDISDHYPVFHITDITNNHKTRYTRTRRINKLNKDSFNIKLKDQDWDYIYNDPDTDNAYNNFASTYSKLYNDSFPYKSTRQNRKKRNKPWITRAIAKSIKNKNKLLRQVRTNYTDTNHDKYKQFRNKLNHIIRISKKKYYHNILEKNKQNFKKTWSILNNIMGRNTKRKNTLPTTFFDDKKSYSSPSDIANQFNSFFTGIGPSLANKIPSSTIPPTHYLKNHISNSIFLAPVTPEEILDLTKLLKDGKSAGPDDIDPGIAKLSLPIIAKPLAHIFNLSITSGIVPTQLKQAKVIPIHKSNDPSQFTNYRPISVLPAFSKLLEKIMYNRVISFINKHSILTNSQYGFRTKHTTHMALIDLLTKINDALIKKHHTIGIFLDLSKAFDTINHNILISKLEHYGIRGNALQWFRHYLTDRQQFVYVHSTKSSLQQLTCGVPQGSILGPLLFLLYINDITHVSTILSYIIFADDTNLLLSHPDFHELQNTTNTELAKLSNWFKANKLSLNIKKTNFMTFSRVKHKHHNTNIFIDDQSIQQVDTTKFLGTIIDSKLNWTAHVNNVHVKVARPIGVLNKLKHFLPAITLKTLYNSLILPHLSYCNIVWGNTCSSRLYSLHILQKKAIRNISLAKYRAHTKPLFKKHKLLTLNDINTFQTSLFMYKYTTNALPPVFNDYFALNSSFHSHNTRQANNFHLPTDHTTLLARRSIRYFGPSTWNAIPSAIRKSNTTNVFKRMLRDNHISLYY